MAAATSFSRTLALVALALAVGCGIGPAKSELDRAVMLYNDGIRWKRFEQAAAFVPPEARDAFLARYQASEDRLAVESIEVRRVVPVEGAERPTFDVTVVAAAYVLPSNVLSRQTIVERWQLADGAWRMIHTDRELAPAR
jgi:hypothetical protein